MSTIIIFLLFVSSLILIESAYNPIPIGSVIISTINQIIILQPKEYGGNDRQTIIYSATNNMTIISSIYDPIFRNLYILFTNSSNGPIYLCQLVSLEQLDTTIYQLPIEFNASLINNLVSFSGDILNRRGFYTNQQGEVTLFSMSGLMQSNISIPLTISSIVRSVTYANTLNRLFIVTDANIDSCVNLDTNNLQCCRVPSKGTAFRGMTFDLVSGDLYAYVLDDRTGIYQVILNKTGCPIAVRPLNAFGPYANILFVIDRGLYFASASITNNNDNSLLMIANGTQDPRIVNINSEIVALHISKPNTQTFLSTGETCFHGITYSIYRTAVILAAIFGTIMGIFMCFNVLFCIDFFMTKRIIQNLKSQIPHDLLEDRWNKLVEEKYAKLALEKQRRKDDPPVLPSRRHPSSGSNRQNSAGGQQNTTDTSANSFNAVETLQGSNPIPWISAYIRRKSESYLSRRRSDDYRHQRQHDSNEARTHAQVHIQPVKEENEHHETLRQNLSRKQLLNDNESFL